METARCTMMQGTRHRPRRTLRRRPRTWGTSWGRGARGGRRARGRGARCAGARTLRRWTGASCASSAGRRASGTSRRSRTTTGSRCSRARSASGACASSACARPTRTCATRSSASRSAPPSQRPSACSSPSTSGPWCARPARAAASAPLPSSRTSSTVSGSLGQNSSLFQCHIRTMRTHIFWGWLT